MSEPPKQPLELFDPSGEVDRTERDLPHWRQAGTATFITFRAADSLPAAVVARQLATLVDWLARHGVSAPPGAGHAALLQTARLRLPQELQREFRRRQDRLWQGDLDRCYGDCVLARPELATIVADALRHFHGDRYWLDSFVVMPNHVHVLVGFYAEVTLAKQSASWLRFTSTRINRVLGRRGAFWQAEPFDHLVRSEVQFEYLRKYIQENPSKAGLAEGHYLYWKADEGRTS